MRNISRQLIFSAMAIAVLGLVVNTASADPPKKAKKFTSDMIEAFDDCTAPTTTTGPPLALPACSAVASDDTCGFGAKGSGRAKATVKGAGGAAPDIKIKLKLKGLNAGCEGETLGLIPQITATTTDCAAGAQCTTIDLPLPIGSCVVVNGKCTINTTANAVFPTVIANGEQLQLEVRGIVVTRNTGAGSPTNTFQNGLFVP